jgi:hypothetical protein
MYVYKRLQTLLNVSDINIQDEIKKYDVPKQIGFIKVTDINDIPIGKMFEIWELKTNEELISKTIDVFLKNTFCKKILFKLNFFNEKYLPLIDFMRLVLYTNEVSELVANYFKSCKVLTVDKRYEAIYNKYKGEYIDVIINFCKIFPSYTIEQAMKVSWVDIYQTVKANTKDINIQIEISQLNNKQ